MRRLILWNMVILDSFFEGRAPWEIDWHEDVWGEEHAALQAERAPDPHAVPRSAAVPLGLRDPLRRRTGAELRLRSMAPKMISFRGRRSSRSSSPTLRGAAPGLPLA